MYAWLATSSFVIGQLFKSTNECHLLIIGIPLGSQNDVEPGGPPTAVPGPGSGQQPTQALLKKTNAVLTNSNILKNGQNRLVKKDSIFIQKQISLKSNNK